MNTARVATLAALAFLVPCFAQAQTTYAEANKALNATATHDGIAVRGYQVYVDDAKAGPELPASARGADGVVRATIPPLPPGPRKLELSAVYVWGTEAKSLPLTVTAVTPVPPGTFTIPPTTTITFATP